MSRLLPVCALLVFLTSCYNIRVKDREEWQQYFDKYGVQGAFEIYDNNKEIANYYNKEACARRTVPGNTFHIFASLAGVEYSVVLDENKPMHWLTRLKSDSINSQLTLRDFYKVQDPYFFSALSKEIGKDKMKKMLDTVKYGNMNIDEGDYWNNGTLQITPDEQVGLMKRLYFNEVPDMSGRTQTIVKSMMLQEENADYKLYYHNSEVKHNDTLHYWLIGMIENYNTVKNPKTEQIEKKIHPYFFALYCSSKDGRVLTPGQRLALVKELLNDYQVKTK